VEVLKSDFLTQGPAIEKFEKCVAEYCGAKYAVAVTSATAALHISCLSAGLGKDDILWTSPITQVPVSKNQTLKPPLLHLYHFRQCSAFHKKSLFIHLLQLFYG